MSISALLYIAFAIIVGVQIVFYLIFLFAFSIRKDSIEFKNLKPISVIICAKNEAENLKNNLPKIINQDYETFEIILVNDRSYDQTLEVMQAFSKTHKNVKVVDIKASETFWGNKKYALTLGIKSSNYDTLVFTDADCYPKSNKWLTNINSKFTDEKEIVLGYSSNINNGIWFLDKLTRFDAVQTAVKYFAFTKMGMPYMGIGKNMAYKKEMFFKNSGFKDHIHIKSGEDTLFINKVSTAKNTIVCYTKESFIKARGYATLKSWFTKKRRIASTFKHYKSTHKFILGSFYASQLLFWIFAILLFTLQYQWQWVLLLFIIRLLVQLLCFWFGAKKLDETSIIFLLPLLEVFLILCQLTIFIANKISIPKHWK